MEEKSEDDVPRFIRTEKNEEEEEAKEEAEVEGREKEDAIFAFLTLKGRRGPGRGLRRERQEDWTRTRRTSSFRYS